MATTQHSSHWHFWRRDDDQARSEPRKHLQLAFDPTIAWFLVALFLALAMTLIFIETRWL